MTNREFDALVAEMVMGWKWATCVKVSCLFPPELYQSTVLDHPALWKEGKTGKPDYEAIQIQYGGYIIPVPDYSTDIAKAWEVVEKIKDQWPDFGITWTGNKWSVSWGMDGHGWQWVEDESITKAICLAALEMGNP